MEDRPRPVEKIRILVVSAHPYRRELIVRELAARMGASVESAADGDQAKRMVREGAPDCLVIDATAARVDGYELAAVLRGYEETRGIPIVFLAGQDDYRMTAVMSVFDERVVVDGAPDTAEIIAKLEKALVARENSLLRERIAGLEDQLATLDGRELRNTTLDPTSGTFRYANFLAIAGRVIGGDAAETIDTSLIVADIDGLGALNSRFGFSEGDRAIAMVSSEIARSVERLDALLCRFAGDKFAVLVSGLSQPLAAKVAARIRSAVAELRFTVGDEQTPLSVACDAVAVDPAAVLEPLIVATLARVRSGKHRPA